MGGEFRFQTDRGRDISAILKCHRDIFKNTIFSRFWPPGVRPDAGGLARRPRRDEPPAARARLHLCWWRLVWPRRQGARDGRRGALVRAADRAAGRAELPGHAGAARHREPRHVAVLLAGPHVAVDGGRLGASARRRVHGAQLPRRGARLMEPQVFAWKVSRDLTPQRARKPSCKLVIIAAVCVRHAQNP